MSVASKIYDPVHGFIKLNEVEKVLIDSYVFQRLHYIHQLGAAYLVYPGATHTRFEHSLGVMEVATQIFDRIAAKQNAPKDPELLSYWRQIVRLAALSHDLGHLPFSHVAEHELLGEGGHEKWTLKVLQSAYLDPVWQWLEGKYPDCNPRHDVIKVSLGESKIQEIKMEIPLDVFTPWERVMTQVVTGDFFGADRIDYLLRDAKCTGVSYGLFDYHQLIEMLCILECKGKQGTDLVLGIEENGIESCEALLLGRHFMHKRVYQYPSVKAYSFHLARFMKAYYEMKHPLSSLENYLSQTDNDILVEIKHAIKDTTHPGHLDALSLFERNYRYHAVEIPGNVTHKDLSLWKEQFQIEEKAIHWRLSHHRSGPKGLSFPVIRKNQSIVDASECSDLFIPSFAINWLYVDPKYSRSIEGAIESRKGTV